MAPNTLLKVCEPAPHSGVLVLPMVMAPARFSRSTVNESILGTLSLNMGVPNVVRMPLVSCRSLWAIGSPCKGPSVARLAMASSALRADSRAISGTNVTIALTLEFTRSICCKCASRTSETDTVRLRIMDASSTADFAVRSLVGSAASRVAPMAPAA